MDVAWSAPRHRAGPAADAFHQALARELLEVAMRGHLRDRVHSREFRDRHGTLALKALENLFAT